jgi:peptidyl-prolyl cis-trans isomerase B (cyclophilin B)
VVVAADGGGERHAREIILTGVSRPLAALVLLALAGCGGSSGSAAKPTPDRAAKCQTVPPGTAQHRPGLPKPHTRLQRGKTYVATVVTGCGSFQITLDPRAPITGGSFLYLVRHRFFDGLTFHRNSPGYVIQGGDPNGNGSGGPGYTVVEPPPAALRYDRGVVAMARSQVEPPGASGSQFFVVTARQTPLDPSYALLGRVTAGMNTVDRIAALPQANELLLRPVPIRSIRIAVSG